MFGRIKLKMTAIALVAIVFTVFTQGTLAFFTTVGKATNVVTSGNIKFVIHETTDQGTPFPERGVYVKPGDIVSKQVSIENICAHPFYLRVKIVSGIEGRTLSAEECYQLNIDLEHWKYSDDGWYYYQGIVQPGEKTPYVFSEVRIVNNQVYSGETLTLSVVAHAVQSENNPLTEGDYSTANGWPKEEGSL